ncbi:HoxN/HupN/NixA family nickel/cobalt transporter [Alicyclobacillus acidoterrestris]|uniref:Nickel/cobalt efflux system n=1 Tax=Alicyclobacillus acidoterrestris (strain ATCC 49025 / DSM 3922 / CIP 106132 / NCIMB 13137 / GD3B) TaxID=1356854 RepID=A0A9E6ZRY7_ALIAG|nr:HoxN/HupN/NixA family nickel/cobalt transporter [Alicyclobacillus acidoterrestris]UNO50834.1 HoxN/HupN/NixA family nickel/cobalt transporter [Alicyclobacillus acidoterrestris]
MLVVALLHAIGIGSLIVCSRRDPALFGLGVLAYTFGLRHAFDADHIAAIDNTVRKLIEQKERPSGVGFYFSIGHSTIVFVLAIGTALATHWVQHSVPQLEKYGGLLGTTISGVFLLLIGGLNLIVLISMCRLFTAIGRREFHLDSMETLLQSRGFFSRFLTPWMKFINKSWHAYPVGVLFGLGFDTATEVALLTISSLAVRQSHSVISVLTLPILFAAGMSLLDTADGILMVGAYRWAFTTPLRKLYYNLSVTGLSVAAAVLIGLVEVGQVIGEKGGLKGPFWGWLQGIDFGELGYWLCALFLVTWALSFGVWKVFRFESRWSHP